MKVLNEGVVGMLGRSHFFDFERDLFVSGVNILLLEYFQFFIPQCFLYEGDEGYKNFKYQWSRFMKKYLFAWAEQKIIENPDFNSLEFGFKYGNYFGDKNLKEVFTKIQDGNGWIDIEISANNSILRLKRFGSLLGIGISAYGDEKHKKGYRALMGLCRKIDAGNNQGIYEFIDSVQCSVSLKAISSNGNFGSDLKATLRNTLRFADLSSCPLDKVVEGYLNINHNGVVIGTYQGFNIVVNLVHREAKDKDNVLHVDHYDKYNAKLVRQGNVQETALGYEFKSFDDLMVVFSLKSSLPNFFENLDIGFDAWDEQFRLIKAGSVFSSQLCGLVSNNWMNYRVS